MRFQRRISVTPNGCWEWGVPRTRDGYGQVSFGGRMLAAHRVVKRLLEGEFRGELDHLCRNRCCVNPTHLEIVSHRENTLRGNTIPAAFAARASCKNGHQLAGANVSMRGNTRVCITCRRTYNRLSQRRRSQA